jgi:uncharacterized protein
VMNHRNYPILTRLLAQLGVELRDSDMSFSYYDEVGGLQYSGTDLNGLFAQRRNLFRPAFHRMIRDLLRFYREAGEDLKMGRLQGIPLGEYLDRKGYSSEFIRDHLLPMAAAIWSTPCERIRDFPAAALVHFFENHGLLSLTNRPQWRTVVGGSHTYVKAILKGFRGSVRTGAPVAGIRREQTSVIVTPRDGEPMRFDAAVIAVHADEAIGMLADPSDEEKRLLGAWHYENNHTVLHTDRSALPPLRRAWASWNYTHEHLSPESSPASLSYHMNRLQGLETQHEYIVSLNRRTPVPQDRIVAEMDYTHPTYSEASMATQKDLPVLNGSRNTYFCGSYFGYGFHEDAVRSGVAVAHALGLDL